MAHILATLMFGMIAIAAAGLISFMLVEARSKIAIALGLSAADPARRYRTPVRVTERRTQQWPGYRTARARHAA